MSRSVQLDSFFADFFSLPDKTLNPLKKVLQKRLEELKTLPHGDSSRWLQAYSQLPDIKASRQIFAAPCISLHSELPLTAPQKQALRDGLRGLCPWRKGPFRVFGVHIDSEWRCHWKWSRLRPHIADLKGRRVLDVGCGSGYHLWRILGEGARAVIGIDPSILFCIQFQAIKKYTRSLPIHCLPLRLETLPTLSFFDSTFSMGVLAHRRSPLDHLAQLAETLKRGGELILETLVIPGTQASALIPAKRYANMGNIWFLPTVPALFSWLKRTGFINTRLVSLNQTNCNEQRNTDWMAFYSLKDFLNPQDPNKTLEGYPAPRRATVVANKA